MDFYIRRLPHCKVPQFKIFGTVLGLMEKGYFPPLKWGIPLFPLRTPPKVALGRDSFSGNRSRHILWFNLRNIQHVVVLPYFQKGFSPVSCGTVTKTPCFVRFQAVNGYRKSNRSRFLENFWSYPAPPTTDS